MSIEGVPRRRPRSLLRLGLGAGALVVIGLLLLQIAHQVVDRPELVEATVVEAAPQEPATVTPEPSPEAEPDRDGGLRITAIEPVRLRVEVDGELDFEGILCAGGPDCDSNTLRVPPAQELAVEVGDLSRARVIYNGRRVKPLGNVSGGRRLVFIDDAGG